MSDQTKQTWGNVEPGTVVAKVCGWTNVRRGDERSPWGCWIGMTENGSVLLGIGDDAECTPVDAPESPKPLTWETVDVGDWVIAGVLPNPVRKLRYCGDGFQWGVDSNWLLATNIAAHTPCTPADPPDWCRGSNVTADQVHDWRRQLREAVLTVERVSDALYEQVIGNLEVQ